MNSLRLVSESLWSFRVLILRQFWKLLRVASMENRKKSTQNMPPTASSWITQKIGIESRSIMEWYAAVLSKTSAMKVQPTYDPMEGTRNPIISINVQCFTLTASFIVTTMITLVYADIQTKQKPMPQELEPLVSFSSPIAQRVMNRQTMPCTMPSRNQVKNLKLVKRVLCWLMKYILGQQEYRICFSWMPLLSSWKVSLVGLRMMSTSKTALMTTGKKVKIMLQKVIDQESQKDQPEPRLQKQQASCTEVKTMFLQKKQRIISATLMQFIRPWYSSSFHSRQNSPIAQLATCAALVPSSPKMPIPT